MQGEEWIFEGNVWRVGDNVNTESIYSTQWHGKKEVVLAHLGELVIPDFPKKVKQGDIWVAGVNFACSSSRDVASLLKEKGIGAILCHSSSRNNFRNAVDAGIPCFEIGDEVKKISMGDRVRVNVRTGEIKNLTTGAEIKAQPYPDFLMETLEAGGVIPKILSRKSEYKIKVT